LGRGSHGVFELVVVGDWAKRDGIVVFEEEGGSKIDDASWSRVGDGEGLYSGWARMSRSWFGMLVWFILEV